MTSFEQQMQRIETRPGFIAALDQSGGSTPKALLNYGVDADAYANEEEMFDAVHAMRTRIITSPGFAGERIMGAILFEMTMEREVGGMPTSHYLWQKKNIVPFLKVDKGLAAEDGGVQMMKPMPGLDALLQRARTLEVFGTKMRSVIKRANLEGIRAVVDQQFVVGAQILAAGLVPIIEPEVDIHSPEKAAAEELLKAALLAHLDQLATHQRVIFKLTLPEEDDFYAECVEHPSVLQVVALSGGYSREEANARLARNRGVVASFSRALTEGLAIQQSQQAFDAMLQTSVAAIYQASIG